MVLRIAMWSGPRNISTAILRSFGARSDTHVSDEPFYAYYLKSTGLRHPNADEVLATHECDWRRVVDEITGPTPAGHTIWYQKHMAHHLLDGVGRDWLEGFVQAFLIREPRAMLTSLLEKLDDVRLEDTGLPQLVELFRRQHAEIGAPPPVVDAKELLLDPEGVLRGLCERLGIPFDSAMLGWEPGPRDTDGCWGPYWYANTYASTGFAPYRHKDTGLPVEYEELARQCEELYNEMARHRIQASP
ncbi:MAG: sulfotransferase family protein [Planctomycetes bacterium]|jgi:hypothetical protein|nr:sulfotransferase family protein [Planctomycetota bacterium]